MILRKAVYILFLLLTGTNFLLAQNTPVRINGNVRDINGNPLPYTTVRIKDTANGCTTDHNGNFSFNAYIEGKTLIVSSIGYEDYNLQMTSATRFPIYVILQPTVYDLQEVTIKPGKDKYVKKGNPAVELATEIINRKSNDNPFNNDYVSRDRYETFVVALDNFTEEKQQRALFSKFPFLKEYVDTSLVSGKPILNVSRRELAATDYYQRKPSRQKQKVHGRDWIGIEDFLPDEEVRAAVEATLRDVDLFNEKVIILRKEFVSPFSDYATSYYRYYLQDTIIVDDEKCVEQKFSRDSEHPRLLIYESITAELKLYDFIDGVYGRREVYYSGYRFNDDVNKEPFMHQEHIIEDSDAYNRNDEFWAQYRSNTEFSSGKQPKDVQEMIARLRQVPLYYWTEQFINLLFSGFIPIKKENTPLYIGPVNTIVSYNGLEKIRLNDNSIS